MDQNNIVLKDLDAWAEVFIVDPITLPLTKQIYKVLKNPLILTSSSFLLGISSAIFLFFGINYLCSIFFFLSTILDGMDGKLARLVNNKRIITVHGTFDVFLDIIRNVILLLVLNYKYPELSSWIMLYFGVLFVYEASYAIRLELRHRMGSTTGYSMTNLISEYEKIITKDTSFGRLIGIYLMLLQKTRKFRTYPNPTLVDSEYVLFILLPLFGNFEIVLLSILFLLPDTFISGFLTIKLSLSQRSDRGVGTE